MKVAIIVSAHLNRDAAEAAEEHLIEAITSAMEFELYSHSAPRGPEWKDGSKGRTLHMSVDAVQIVRLEEAETLMVVGKAIIGDAGGKFEGVFAPDPGNKLVLD